MLQTRLAYKVLFDEEGPGRGALFSSISDLADEIQRVRPSDRPKNLPSFLSQILNLGLRSCPDSLIEGISQAVEARLQNEPPGVREEWAARVRRALETDNRSRKSGEPLSAEVLYGELLLHAETAEEHYIITAVTAEEAISQRAEPLREILLRRLHVIEADTSITPTTRYTFCLPSGDACTQWWDSLIREARQRIPHARSAKMVDYLSFLDQNDYIRVFAVPPTMCGCPVVVFNPDRPNLAGFNIYYFSDPDKSDESLVSVSKMDPVYLPKWRSLVHSQLENDRVDRTRIHLVRPVTSRPGS